MTDDGDNELTVAKEDHPSHYVLSMEETEKLIQRNRQLSGLDRSAISKKRRKILSPPSQLLILFLAIGLLIIIGAKVNQTVQERKAFDAEMVRIVHSKEAKKTIEDLLETSTPMP
ncbi:hypothetical protein A200_05387 [Parascardovia denticolens IPLA 20019]|uniref:hypothetical protein n=1 Tax=Parascardovia denticolens TaxID=78258 RepID=UPI000266A3A6|nr:hypothetical protein [Parascardovia denticolens]EIT87983.1 hypothetical protein A200_05387 [Parascardovia denticolens IPLA 20019]